MSLEKQRQDKLDTLAMKAFELEDRIETLQEQNSGGRLVKELKKQLTKVNNHYKRLFNTKNKTWRKSR